MKGGSHASGNFRLTDHSGNGYASVAEFDAWIQKRLLESPTLRPDEAERLWRAFRPCYIRAHADAADVTVNKRVGGTRSATTDDFIQFSEFRLANAYLCIYAGMFDAFSLIDGESEGTTLSDDRRISLAEWQDGYSRVKLFGFKALADIADDHCSTVFNHILLRDSFPAFASATLRDLFCRPSSNGVIKLRGAECSRILTLSELFSVSKST